MLFMNFFRFFSFLFLLLPFSLPAQHTKGFYVDGFSTILGNQQKEDSLLRFAQNNAFNYLTLYQMHIVHANTPLTNVGDAQPFADFVQKAKTQFGIAEIGVAVENFNSVNTVYHIYNQQHSVSQQIDVYNLEFEFWVPSSVETGGYYCETYLQPNGYSCDTSGAFAFHNRILTQIDSVAAIDGVKSEAYFGWFNEGQGAQIVQSGVDRVLISAYIPSADYSAAYQYNYIDTRLMRLASAGEQVKVMGLYSAEADFMQSWAVTHDYFQPYNDLVTGLATETAQWKNSIQTEGIQWFAYTDMPKKNMDLGLGEDDNQSFVVYPNPSEGSFRIKTSKSIQGEPVKIEDLEGRNVYSGFISESEIAVDLSPGSYFVRLKGRSEKLIVY